MNLRTFSTGAKITLLVVGLSIIGYIVSASQKAWFNQIATPSQVKSALEEFPDAIDVVDADGITGLMMAAKNSYVERAKLLIKYKASLDMKAKNEKDKDDERRYGNTALHFAVLNGDDSGSYEIAKLLIASGADVKATNDKGYTALHFILSIGDLNRRIELMKLLMAASGNALAQTAYLNAQNDEGNTMLHLAALMNRMDWIAALIKEYGKELKFDIKNIKGEYPENVAKEAAQGYAAARLAKVREMYANLAKNPKTVDADYKKIDFMNIPY